VKVLVVFDISRRAAAGETFSPRELKEQEDKETEADVLACLKRLGHEVETLAVFDDVLPIVEKMVSEGLVVLSDVDIIKYAHRATEIGDSKG